MGSWSVKGLNLIGGLGLVERGIKELLGLDSEWTDYFSLEL